MKKLFILALAVVASDLGAAPAEKKKRPAAETTAPAAVAPAPVKERAPTPGFWERAWGSTKKTTAKVGRVVTRPFGGKKDKEEGPKTGWKNLSVTLTTDPVAVKLPEAKSLQVNVIVANQGKELVQLDFPTTQRIEVLLKTEGDKVLSKWSEDQKVDEEQGFLVVNPDERLQYTANISTREMSAGTSYVIEAYFPTYPQLRASTTVTPTK